MKKVLLFLLAIMSSVACFSQEKPVLKWDKKVHDFGCVNPQKKDVISVVFHFKVIGDAPAVIHEVKATCGCTTVEWSKQAVRPNDQGEVLVNLDLRNLKGSFDKHLFVKTNADSKVELLRVKGFVE